MLNIMIIKIQKFVTHNFMKTVSEIPGKPHENPKTIVQHFVEKHVSAKFHNFCAKSFSSFQNVPPLAHNFFAMPFQKYFEISFQKNN